MEEKAGYVDYMIDNGPLYEFEHCKLMHAIWFSDVPPSKFRGGQLQSETDLKIVLTAASFGKIEMEEEALIKLLKVSAIDNEDIKGRFCSFYDKIR